MATLMLILAIFSKLHVPVMPWGLLIMAPILKQSIHVHTEPFMSSFFICIIGLWDILPKHILDCSTPANFSSLLLGHYNGKLSSDDINNSCSLTSIPADAVVPIIDFTFSFLQRLSYYMMYVHYSSFMIHFTIYFIVFTAA